MQFERNVKIVKSRTSYFFASSHLQNGFFFILIVAKVGRVNTKVTHKYTDTILDKSLTIGEILPIFVTKNILYNYITVVRDSVCSPYGFFYVADGEPTHRDAVDGLDDFVETVVCQKDEMTDGEYVSTFL